MSDNAFVHVRDLRVVFAATDRPSTRSTGPLRYKGR